MSNNYNVIECCLCGIPYGFTFADDLGTNKHENHYCYSCGHAVLLLKNKFSHMDFRFIKDTTIEQNEQGGKNETAVYYYLNKLEK